MTIAADIAPAGQGPREAPVAPRLFGVDTARGIALFGMFAAHTIPAGGEQVYDGRSSILFATVAGVSLGLLTGGATPPLAGARTQPRLAILIRGAVLILLGLLLTTIVRPPIAVILDYYGAAFLLLIGVIFLSRRSLLLLTVVVTIAGPLVLAAVTERSTIDDVPAPLQLVAFWLIYGYYPLVVWLAFLLGGLVLARFDLRDRRTAAGALGVGALAAVAGYAAAVAVPGLSAEAHSGIIAEVVGSGGVAIAVVGLLSLLDSATGAGAAVARVVRFVLAPVAAAGSMALTLYTAHAILLGILRAALPQPERWAAPDGTFAVLAVAALGFASLWRRFLGTGPLERGLRALTRRALYNPSRPGAAR